MERQRTRLVGWEEVIEWSHALSEKISSSKFIPDFVVAIARGGYVPARFICDFLEIHDLIGIQVLHWGRAAEMTATAHVKHPFTIDLSGKKVLLVDDIVDTGDSVAIAKDYILSKWGPKEVKIAAMQWISSTAKLKPDFFAEDVKEWVWYQYPWTRAEDTADFLERIISEKKKNMELEQSFEALVSEFKKIYGIDVGERYYNIALKNLEKAGKIKINGDKIIVVGANE